MKTEYKDGWLTIREEENLSDKPIRRIIWWPVAQASEAYLRDCDLLDKEATYQGNGSYSLRIAPYQYRTAILKDAGQTRAIAIEDVPIPAPKVRKGIQTRYYNSSWQKYSTVKGWVLA